MASGYIVITTALLLLGCALGGLWCRLRRVERAVESLRQADAERDHVAEIIRKAAGHDTEAVRHRRVTYLRRVQSLILIVGAATTPAVAPEASPNRSTPVAVVSAQTYPLWRVISTDRGSNRLALPLPIGRIRTRTPAASRTARCRDTGSARHTS